MAIFFFFVTLEIKREFIQGELSNLKKALLTNNWSCWWNGDPCSCLYCYKFWKSETLNGWAIPSATDIAFS